MCNDVLNSDVAWSSFLGRLQDTDPILLSVAPIFQVLPAWDPMGALASPQPTEDGRAHL